MKQPDNEATEMPVGEILRRTRLHYSKTIEDVEAALRIQSKQIHAIEIGDAEALPARVYAVGFVRSYAEYLGLDGQKIVDLFKSQSEGKGEAPDLKIPKSRYLEQGRPFGLFITLLALLCMGAALTLDFEGQAEALPEIIPEVPKELSPAVLEEKQVAVVQEPEPAPAPEPAPVQEKPKGIVLKLISNSWIEIRDQNNRKLISRVLQAGDQYFVPDRLGLSMSIGNAGGVEILVNGEPLQNIGQSGQVLRRVPLNAEALLQRFPRSIDNTVDNQSENQ